MYFVDPCDQNLRPPVFALLFVIYKINDIFHSHPCVFLCLFEQKRVLSTWRVFLKLRNINVYMYEGH